MRVANLSYYNTMSAAYMLASGGSKGHRLPPPYLNDKLKIKKRTEENHLHLLLSPLINVKSPPTDTCIVAIAEQRPTLQPFGPTDPLQPKLLIRHLICL